MNIGKILKYLFFFLLASFTFLFVASSNGYYEYQLKEKTTLTEDAIKQFEQDIKDGKKVDLSDYLPSPKKDYNNKISKTNQKISKGIENAFSFALKALFEYVTSSLEE